MHVLFTEVHTTQIKHCCVSYRGDHAVVLLPGSAAAEKGDKENHHTDYDDDDGGS